MIESTVKVNKNILTGHVRYGGLMMCCRVWNCPICAVRITEQRREELDHGVKKLTAGGGGTLLLTVTLSHNDNDRLEPLLNTLLSAMQRTKRGNPWSKFRKRHGIVGGVYSLEVTWGEATGWHPHRHELFMLDHVPDGHEIAVMLAWLKDRYLKMLLKAGGSASRAHGLTLVQDTVAGYVAKFGHDPAWLTDKTAYRWSEVHEVTKSPAKSGHNSQRLTPFGMLRVVLESDDPIRPSGAAPDSPPVHLVARKWIEYAGVFHGRRQLVWWRGTKALLGIVEITDDEIVNELEEFNAMAYITRAGWQRVLKLNSRVDLLREAEKGPVALVAFCRAVGIEMESVSFDDD
jgi:hypothetical protein